MFTTWQSRRTIGRFAWAMAWFGLVAGQLHALSRHQIADGKADLELPLTRFWAEPAGDVLRPLLDWANPDAVYLTYGKIWLPICAATALAAIVVYSSRSPQGFEKWAWRISIAGYVAVAVAVGATYWLQWSHFTVMDDIGLAAEAPGILLTMFGSTALGISLLRQGFRPRTPAVLLALAIPGLFAISSVTSLGSAFLTMSFAFGILGRNIARDPSYVDTLVARPKPGRERVPA